MTQAETSSQPILPINIVPLDGTRQQERWSQLSVPPSASPKDKDAPSDLRHWQIEEFLRQKGLADNTQRAYRRQLKTFSSWCNKSWLDVTPSDIGKYRRELKHGVSILTRQLKSLQVEKEN